MFRGPFGSAVVACRGNVVDATEPIKNLNQRVLIEPRKQLFFEIQLFLRFGRSEQVPIIMTATGKYSPNT